MSKLLLVDGNNLFYRAYHALPPLTDKTGENANAVFGISNMLLKAVNEVKPSYVACAFDTKAPTFRHVEFEAYKAQRKAPPDDLYPQLPKVKSVLDAFGIKYFEKAGYEADDLLGTLAMQNLDKVDEVVILSGDRDVLQLVDGKIKVQMPGWNLPAGKAGLAATTLFGSAEVLEKYGITPLQMVDYKAMTGDPSDNIPGVAGIGPKMAAALLQKYKTLEGIYGHIDEISGTTKDKLEKDKEIALAAKKLVQLDCDVDLATCLPAGRFDLSDLEFKPNWEKVISEYERLGFKSIVAKLQGKAVSKAKSPSVADKNKDQLELI